MDYGQITLGNMTCWIKEVKTQATIPRCFCIYNYFISKKPCAYALVMEEAGKPTEAQLWHIWTKKEERRLGYASALIDTLKKKYLRIVTQIATREGRELCLKHGFSWKPALTKNGDDWLIWEKPVEEVKKDAVDEKGS